MSATLRLPSAQSFKFNRPFSSGATKRSIVAVAATLDCRSRKPTNLYEILRVEETASPIEIKTAYRSLAKRFHPDAGSDGRDFMEIHEAYETLSDPTARALYDLSIRRRRFRFRPGFRPPTKRWETDQCW
ncbi:hypothetical protein ACLOJK_041598 [Asimina triloba]